MKIPKKIKIGGHIFKIDMSKKLPGLNGSCDYKTNTIAICKSLPPSQKEVTLFHEIFHAINSTLCDQHDMHKVVDSMSEQLYAVFKINNLLK